MSRAPIGRVLVALIYAGGMVAACAADSGDPKKTGTLAESPGVDSGGVDTGQSSLDSSISTPDSPFESFDTGSPDETGAPDEGGTTEASVEDSPVVVTCTNCPLQAQYLAGSTTDPTQNLSPYFQILNNGVTAQDLTEVTLRYWYTEDASTSQIMACDYTALPGSCASITGTAVAMATPTPTADHYMELAFSSGSIPGEGGLTGPIQTRIHDTNYAATMTQANDYSFNAADITYTTSMTVTLYRAGTLVWGVEP
jgi:hypothetical protein